MFRRRYLAIVGIGLAGCTGSGTEEIDDNEEAPADDDTDGDRDTSADDETPTEKQSTEEPETEELDGGEPDIVLGEPELVIEEGDYSTDIYVDVDVQNEGDAPSGTVKLDVRWFNEDGDFIDDRSHRLYTLGAGESWAARIYHIGSDSEEVADFELEGEFRTELPSTPPEGVGLIESELQVGDRSADIVGRVENNTGEELSYLQAIGKIYDDGGVVLGSARTNETDIPADTTWKFEISWRGRDRVELAEDYELVLADSVS